MIFRQTRAGDSGSRFGIAPGEMKAPVEQAQLRVEAVAGAFAAQLVALRPAPGFRERLRGILRRIRPAPSE
jgi:hypothetical protein